MTLDRSNVRNLLNAVKEGIGESLKSYLFDPVPDAPLITKITHFKARPAVDKITLPTESFTAHTEGTSKFLQGWKSFIEDRPVPARMSNLTLTTLLSLKPEYASILAKSHKTNGKRRQRRHVRNRKYFTNAYLSNIKFEEITEDSNEISVNMQVSYGS